MAVESAVGYSGRGLAAPVAARTGRGLAAAAARIGRGLAAEAVRIGRGLAAVEARRTAGWAVDYSLAGCNLAGLNTAD